ncbi:hypothetical protein CH253_21180 [Rhodococcus sp. 06-156-3C]|uniref:hypothetical protein n=1 Tax=Nocardiaceae TaxID=85025 RepID=UPI000522EB6B|nr:MULTISPECIES: hypothetical protein [Rhodococcus]OZD08768.1 hypothetical protein CH280_24020 [Rhodococcus sp. 06-156-4C]OZD17345.1 hypothetical protein CH253_21180 [Rhodococcus sp. 06-156-3C]OZD18682.1 hypothetical protein CH248_18000 [Rhodococcus sp. 06-156-4a]OZD25089.1 hypothetical protein CH247_27540 [Rhodococcus sp. 06-156-3b]OZD34248.1 hypothetical protein CH284_17630 [Rhodococcus sp. 06-156-3]
MSTFENVQRQLQPIRRRSLRAVSVVAAALGILVFAAPSAFAEVPEVSVTQPGQAQTGPGSSDYSNLDYTVSSGGIGSDAWYVFEPSTPTPSNAPVAVITHGYFEFDGYEAHRSLIEHTVEQGNIVVYPRYQTTAATACPGPFFIEPCIASATAGIKGALDFLTTNPAHVQPDLSRVSYFGHSFGGIITTNISNRYRELGLPEPKAIFLDDPHDGGFAGVGEPALDDDLSGIPADTVFQCYVGESGVIGEQGKQDSSCNAIFPRLGQIPEANKDLILSYDDDRGSPALSSKHGVSNGGALVGNQFIPAPNPPDAYDFKLWQLWDAARNYAYTGAEAEYAVGDTPQRRDNGTWSDGVPVRELKIQKTAPIGP